MSKARRGATIALTTLIVSLSGDMGCSGTTGARRFAFETKVGGVARDPREPFTFTNDKGWRITLTKATVTVGPIYMNVIAPVHEESSLRRGQRPSPSRFAVFGHGLVRPALAAQTAYLTDGRYVGEVLSQVTFDALSPDLVTVPAQGTLTEELVRSTEVWLYPPPHVSPDAVNIDSPALDVAGEAIGGSGDTIRFRGELVLNGAWMTDATDNSRSATPIAETRKVRGIPSSFLPLDGGHLEIRFDVRALFRGADFTNLAPNPADADGTKILVQSKSGKVTTDQVMRTIHQAMRASTGTYLVRWDQPHESSNHP